MTTPNQRGRGRPSHEPTEATRLLVAECAGFGVPLERICQSLNVTKGTLRKHYRAELDRGFGILETRLSKNLLRLAAGDGPTALRATMFALQTRFGWSQYKPPPAPPPKPEEKLGKKAAANEAAKTAHEGTSWADLVKH